MLTIAICDDKLETITCLKNLIKKNVNTHILLEYNSISDLKTETETIINSIDVLFLDIEFPEENENGIIFAKKIQSLYPNIQIIFITGYVTYLGDIFEIKPTYFLSKPITEQQFLESLNKATEKIKNMQTNQIKLTTNSKTIYLNYNNINYIECLNRIIIIHTDTKIPVKLTLDELEKILPNEFLRCHQSYIVNMNKIKCLLKKDIILIDGTEIPISQLKYQKTKKNFLNFLDNSLYK